MPHRRSIPHIRHRITSIRVIPSAPTRSNNPPSKSDPRQRRRNVFGAGKLEAKRWSSVGSKSDPRQRRQRSESFPASGARAIRVKGDSVRVPPCPPCPAAGGLAGRGRAHRASRGNSARYSARPGPAGGTSGSCVRAGRRDAAGRLPEPSGHPSQIRVGRGGSRGGGVREAGAHGDELLGGGGVDADGGVEVGLGRPRL
jgi:hypothetical protein